MKKTILFTLTTLVFLMFAFTAQAVQVYTLDLDVDANNKYCEDTTYLSLEPDQTAEWIVHVEWSGDWNGYYRIYDLTTKEWVVPCTHVGEALCDDPHYNESHFIYELDCEHNYKMQLYQQSNTGYASANIYYVTTGAHCRLPDDPVNDR